MKKANYPWSHYTMPATDIAAQDSFPPYLAELEEESKAALEGKWDEVMKSQIAEVQPDDRFSWVFAERYFLKGCACYRAGERSAGNLFFDIALKTAKSRSKPEFMALQARHALERAADFTNRGYFKNAKLLLNDFLNSRGAMSQHILTQLRYFNIASVLFIGLGEFEKAEKLLLTEKNLLKNANHEQAEVGWKRRFLILELERGALDNVEVILKEIPTFSNLSPLNAALIQVLLIRVFLLKKEIAQARTHFGVLLQIVSANPQIRGIVDVLEIECELLLHQRNSFKMLSRLRVSISAAQQRNDIISTFRYLILKARCQSFQGRHGAALETCRKVEKIIRREAFPTECVTAYFHFAGIAFRAGLSKNCDAYLLKAGNLAKELGIGVKIKCFEYLLQRQRSSGQKNDPILSLLKFPNNGFPFVHYLEEYSFLSQGYFLIETELNSQIMREDEALLWLKKFPGGIWFENTKILFLKQNKKCLERKFDGQMASVAGMFWQLLKGSSSGEIYSAVTGRNNFHKVRHGAYVRKIISRFRLLTNPFGLTLQFDSVSSKYLLRCEMGLCKIKFKSQKRAAVSRAVSPVLQKKTLLKGREGEVHAILQLQKSASSATLRNHLGGISRQTMNVVLLKLRRRGLVQKEGSGRKTVYTLV